MTIKYLFVLPFAALFLILGSVSVFAQTDVPYPTDTVLPSSTLAPTPMPSIVPTSAVILPETPQGVAAVAINKERIDVSWKKATNASAYEVFRNNELIAVVGSLFYSDNGLTPETTYSYKVRSFDGSNYSQFSTTVSVTTKSENDNTPEPTIPTDPDVSERQPTVFDGSGESFVTVGLESRRYDSVGAFDAGEDFVINGRTESFADIEVLIQPNSKSFYTKADDKGFWDVKVDTTDLEPGIHTFQIIISADGFPEDYESEEHMFEINEVEADEDQNDEVDSFGSKVSRIVWVLLLVVVISFAALSVVAVKKGWFKKIFGKNAKDGNKTGEGSPPSDGSSLEGTIGDIGIDTEESETKPTEPEAVQADPEPKPMEPDITTTETESADPAEFEMTPIQEDPLPVSSQQSDTDVMSTGIQNDEEASVLGDVSGADERSTLTGMEEEGVTPDEDFPVMDLSPTKGVSDYSSVTDVSPGTTPVTMTDSGAEEMVVGSNNTPDAAGIAENIEPLEATNNAGFSEATGTTSDMEDTSSVGNS